MAKPGFRWRLLAHRTNGEPVDIVSAASRRAGDKWWREHSPGSPRPGADREQIIAEPSCFDEVVIDDWFHIEQMDTRLWWMSIGNGETRTVVWVRIDGKGKTTVTVSED